MKTNGLIVALSLGALLILAGGTAGASWDYGMESSSPGETMSTESPSSEPQEEAIGTGELPGAPAETFESQPSEPLETGSAPGEATEKEEAGETPSAGSDKE